MTTSLGLTDSQDPLIIVCMSSLNLVSVIFSIINLHKGGNDFLLNGLGSRSFA